MVSKALLRGYRERALSYSLYLRRCHFPFLDNFSSVPYGCRHFIQASRRANQRQHPHNFTHQHGAGVALPEWQETTNPFARSFSPASPPADLSHTQVHEGLGTSQQDPYSRTLPNQPMEMPESTVLDSHDQPTAITAEELDTLDKRFGSLYYWLGGRYPRLPQYLNTLMLHDIPPISNQVEGILDEFENSILPTFSLTPSLEAKGRLIGWWQSYLRALDAWKLLPWHLAVSKMRGELEVIELTHRNNTSSVMRPLEKREKRHVDIAMESAKRRAVADRRSRIRVFIELLMGNEQIIIQAASEEQETTREKKKKSVNIDHPSRIHLWDNGQAIWRVFLGAISFVTQTESISSEIKGTPDLTQTIWSGKVPFPSRVSSQLLDRESLQVAWTLWFQQWRRGETSFPDLTAVEVMIFLCITTAWSTRMWRGIHSSDAFSHSTSQRECEVLDEDLNLFSESSIRGGERVTYSSVLSSPEEVGRFLKRETPVAFRQNLVTNYIMELWKPTSPDPSVPLEFLSLLHNHPTLGCCVSELPYLLSSENHASHGIKEAFITRNGEMVDFLPRASLIGEDVSNIGYSMYMTQPWARAIDCVPTGEDFQQYTKENGYSDTFTHDTANASDGMTKGNSSTDDIEELAIIDRLISRMSDKAELTALLYNILCSQVTEVKVIMLNALRFPNAEQEAQRAIGAIPPYTLFRHVRWDDEGSDILRRLLKNDKILEILHRSLANDLGAIAKRGILYTHETCELMEALLANRRQTIEMQRQHFLRINRQLSSDQHVDEVLSTILRIADKNLKSGDKSKRIYESSIAETCHEHIKHILMSRRQKVPEVTTDMFRDAFQALVVTHPNWVEAGVLPSVMHEDVASVSALKILVRIFVRLTFLPHTGKASLASMLQNRVGKVGIKPSEFNISAEVGIVEQFNNLQYKRYDWQGWYQRMCDINNRNLSIRLRLSDLYTLDTFGKSFFDLQSERRLRILAQDRCGMGILKVDSNRYEDQNDNLTYGMTKISELLADARKVFLNKEYWPSVYVKVRRPSGQSKAHYSLLDFDRVERRSNELFQIYKEKKKRSILVTPMDTWLSIQGGQARWTAKTKDSDGYTVDNLFEMIQEENTPTEKNKDDENDKNK